MLNRLLIVIFFLPFLIFGQSYPAKPTNYVTDETQTLTLEQQNVLNQKLKHFEDSTSNQIFVYIASSLNGQDMESLCQEIFHNWHIGQNERNNGVLIAIFIDDHKFRIQTGYGLEGALPDLLTKRIQDNDMRPLFKQGDYYGGIAKGIDLLTYYSSHEFSPDLVKEETAVESYWESWVIGYCTNILFLILYIRNVIRGKKNLSKKQKKKQGNQTVRKTIFIIIAVMIALFPCVGGFILMFMMIFTSNFKGFSSGGSYSSSSSSSWSSSSDSSWSSSSSSDFGGGGGGDSGGGGSSSDW